MTYVLFEMHAVPLTKGQKEKGMDPRYTVDRVKTVYTRQQADVWVNEDSGIRSWSEIESRN